MINYTYTEAENELSQLSDDFNQWELANEEGPTIAHKVIRCRPLPEHFSQWHLASKDGWTVAHEGAMWRHLPTDFTQWDLATNNGWSVAQPTGHVAAYYGGLPDNFDRWGIDNIDGLSVLDYFLHYSCDSKCYNRFLTKWEMEKPACRAQGDWDVFKKMLPEVYTKYTIITFMNNEDSNKAIEMSML
jgi:hypothetical protein